MKALLTLAFVLFIGTFAQAQNRTPETKVAAVKMGIVQVSAIRIAVIQQETQVARLYRRAGSRVKKELSFTTKKDQGIA